MATVGVEFTVYGDGRYKVLGKLTGTDHWAAIARVSSIWMQCIERNTYHLKKSLIDALMEIDGFANAMIEAELAEDAGEGIVRIKGTRGRIEYLEEARKRQKLATDAAKAKRDAERKKRELGPQGDLFGDESPKLDPTLDPKLDPKSDPPLESSSASASVSSSVSDSDLKTGKQENKPRESQAPRRGKSKSSGSADPEIGRRAKLIIATYVDAYRKQYDGADPPIEGRNAGAARHLAGMKRFSDEHLAAIVEEYVGMEDAWFLTKAHDLPTLLANLNKVTLKLQTGASLTSHEVRSRERKQTTLNTFGKRIREAEARERGGGR